MHGRCVNKKCRETLTLDRIERLVPLCPSCRYAARLAGLTVWVLMLIYHVVLALFL